MVTPTLTPSSTQTLPVDLSEFSAREENGLVKLYWKTESESNNRGFEIQRSQNIFGFRKIGWVDGAGNANRAIAYSFQDGNVAPNVQYYYRLKQIDFDGRSDYSRKVAILLAGKNKIIVKDIYPNVVSADYINLEIIAVGTNTVEVFIHNMIGLLISKKQSRINNGNNTIKVDLQNANSGIYIVNLKFSSGEKHVKRFIKK